MNDNLKELTTLFKKDGIEVTNFESLENDVYLNLFNPILNIIFGGNMNAGFPVGKFISLAGMPGAGKSFIALTIAAAMQKHGYLVVWLDSEGFADNKSMLHKFDIDTENFARMPVETVEDLGKICSKITTEIEEGKLPKKTIIFVDSVGQLTTEKEMGQVDDGATAVDMGYRAKVIKKVFNGFKSKIYENKISFVLVQHMYQSPDMYKPDQVAGGKYLEFLAQMQLTIKKTKDQDQNSTNDKQKYGGIKMIVEAKKHRIIKESTTIEMKLNFDTGLSKRHGILDLCPDEYIKRCSDKGKKYWVRLVNEELEKNAFGKAYLEKVTDTSFAIEKGLTQAKMKGYIVLEEQKDRLIVQNDKKKNEDDILKNLKKYITPDIKVKINEYIIETFCYSNAKNVEDNW